MNNVTVVDYGTGNLLSIVRAIEHCGGHPLITADPDKVRRSERVILPGVGAFGDGMAALRVAGLVDALVDYAHTGRPLLGICLGMQMLMNSSDEFGLHRGLSLIRGNVHIIPSIGADGTRHNIPHIGWSALLPPNWNTDRWRGTSLKRLRPGNAVYFVHSFVAKPDEEDRLLAYCEFNGLKLCAGVQQDNIVGCQFHPEKSGEAGLSIITSFIEQ